MRNPPLIPLSFLIQGGQGEGEFICPEDRARTMNRDKRMAGRNGPSAPENGSMRQRLQHRHR